MNFRPTEKPRVVVLAQEDDFFLPSNLARLTAVAHVVEVDIIDSKSALANRPVDFLKWFGFWQVAKLASRVIHRRAEAMLDRLASYRLLGGTSSVGNFARSRGIPMRVVTDPNASEFAEHIQRLCPDIVASYSCPMVLRAHVLMLPRLGVINVHGSLLPRYRGVLPSFWVLFNGEQEAGATVHFMSQEIDDGPIILQRAVKITPGSSMFDVIAQTKAVGGELVAAAVARLYRGDNQTRPNDASEGSYFTWPSVEQAKRFRARGGRLV